MRSKGQTYLLKELSETRISNGAFNDPKKVGRGYRLINVSDLYVEPKINVNNLTRLEVTPKELHNFSVKRGDIFFTRSSLKLEGIAHCNIFDSDTEDVIYECHVMRVRPKQHLVLPTYLKEYCRSDMARKYFMRNAKTTTMTTIDQDGVGALPVVVPPLNIQKTIVELMTTWNSAIEKTERLIEAKEKRFSWLLTRLISRDKHTRGHIRDFTTEVSKRNSAGDIDRVLSVTNNRGFVLPEDQFERRVASSDLGNYKIVNHGQYAYNPSRINVGSIARLDEWDKGVLSPMYVVFKVNEKKVNSDFFLHWLSSHGAKERIRRSAQGSVRETVSFTDLGAIPFPLPSLAQQQQNAETLNIARQEIDLLKKQAEAYRKQKRGLMQKLLTGQWRMNIGGEAT